MMSTKKYPTPQDIERLLRSLEDVTAEQAAKAQLETAVWLWFHQDYHGVPYEPVAIHTLASAVQGLLHQVARETGQQPSRLAIRMSATKDKDAAILRRAQNFYKHGTYTGKSKHRKSVANIPDMTEMMLADNVGTYNRLFKRTTPLLDLFLVRYSWSYPASKVRLKTLEVELGKRIKIEEAKTIVSRVRFLKRLLPLIVEISAPGRKAFAERGFFHSGNPPE
jgi:hypothetical protein